MRVLIWALVASALIAFAAYYFANARFSIREVSSSDDMIDVELIEPIAPPAS